MAKFSQIIFIIYFLVFWHFFSSFNEKKFLDTKYEPVAIVSIDLVLE